MKNIAKYLLMGCCWILLMSMSNCKDNPKPKDLPDATQEGKNTFGCIIEDHVMIPHGGIAPGDQTMFVGVFKENGTFSFTLTVFQDLPHYPEEYLFKIRADRIPALVPGTYKMTAPQTRDVYHPITGTNSWYSYFYSSPPITAPDREFRGIYTTTGDLNGEISITKVDFERHIVSGTFTFDARNEYEEVVHVKQGRFDVTFDEIVEL